MEQTEEKPGEAKEVTKRNSEENFKWEEWTIVEGTPKENKGFSMPATNTEGESSTEELNCSDAEEACQSLETPILERTVEVQPSEAPDGCNEESDGVSVISDNNDEETTLASSENRIVAYREESHRCERQSVKSITEVATRSHFLIACSILVVVIAAGLGSYFQHDTSTDVDYALLKSKHKEVADRMKEFTNTKEILEDIQRHLARQTNTRDSLDSSVIERTEKSDAAESTLGPDEQTERSRRSVVNLKNPFDGFKNLMLAVCLVLDDHRLIDETVPSRPACDPERIYSEIVDMRVLLDNAIGEMDESAQVANRGFLDSVDFRMKTMGESLVTDFIMTLGKFNFKAEKRMEKLMHKMNERLCILRNTMPSTSKTRQVLEANRTFVESCGRAANKKVNSKKKEKERSPGDEAKFNGKVKHSYNRRQKNSTDRANSNKENKRPDKVAEHPRPQVKSESDDRTPTAEESKTSWKSRENRKKHEEEKNHFQKENEAQMEEKKEAWFREFEEKMNRERDSQIKEYDDYKGKNINWRHGREHDSSSEDDVDSGYGTPRGLFGRKKFKRSNSDWLSDDLAKEIAKASGQWQFDRSRVRDEMRKDESSDNWYIDRMRNRKVSRVNLDDYLKNRRSPVYL